MTRDIKMKGFYIIYFHLLLLVEIKDICSQNVTILPYPTAVVKQDSNLTLYCSYHGYYRPEILTIWEWKLDGNTFGFLYQRGNETLWPFGVMFNQTLYRYNCTSDFTTLTILNVGEERHNETWGCSVRLGQEFYESDSTIVYVEVPVTYIDFLSPAGASVNVTENVATQFICLTPRSRPQATIRWYMTSRSSSLGNGSVRYYDNNITSTFYIAFNRSENGVEVFCTAVNLDDVPPVQSNRKEIYVQYPPETPTFKLGTQSLAGTLSVVRGDNVTVTCDSTSNPGPDFRWTGQPPGVRILTINNIQAAATKTCTVTNTMVPTVGSSDSGLASASLHIIAMSEPTVPELSYFSNASSKVLLTASKLIVIRETSFSVHCSGSTSIPGPRSYEWAGLNTSTLSFTDIGVQDAGIYTCNVTNIMVRTVGATKTGRSSKHLIVEVQYPPVIRPLQNYVVVENEPSSLPCTASSNPPPASYIWKRSKDTFVQQSSTLTIEHAKREDSDAYTCTVRNQMFPTVAEGETNGEESYTVNLTVLYHPDIKLTQMNGTIREGDVNVVLLCAAKGEPQTYTFAKWIHFAPGGMTMIQEYTSTLINNGEAYLIFRNISYMDSGRYQCSVSNGISDYKTGDIFVTSNTDQTVKGRPVIIQTDQTVASSLHENVSLWTTYYSDDGSTPTTEWYRMGDETKTVVNQTNKIFSADETLAVTVPFYTVRTAQQGHKSLLFINDIMETDFGDYEVVISNSIGKTASRVRLIVQSEGQTESTAEQSKEGITAGIVGGLVGIIVGAVFGAFIMFRYRKAIREKCLGSGASNQEQYHMYEQAISPENVPSEAGDDNALDIMKENFYEDLDSRRKQDAAYESLQPGNRRESKDGEHVYHNLTFLA